MYQDQNNMFRLKMVGMLLNANVLNAELLSFDFYQKMKYKGRVLMSLLLKD